MTTHVYGPLAFPLVEAALLLSEQTNQPPNNNTRQRPQRRSHMDGACPYITITLRNAHSLAALSSSSAASPMKKKEKKAERKYGSYESV